MHKIKEFYLAALTVKIKIQKLRLFQFQNKFHCTYTSTWGEGGSTVENTTKIWMGVWKFKM